MLSELIHGGVTTGFHTVHSYTEVFVKVKPCLVLHLKSFMLHSHGVGQTVDGKQQDLVNSRGKNKQSDGMEGQQNETPMMMCCCGYVVLFTKNETNYATVSSYRAI